MPSEAGYVDVAVSKAAANVRSLNPRVGFDFGVIIASLLPLIASCFSRSPERSQDPQEFLEDNYDELTATISPSRRDHRHDLSPQTKSAMSVRRVAKIQAIGHFFSAMPSKAGSVASILPVLPGTKKRESPEWSS